MNPFAFPIADLGNTRITKSTSDIHDVAGVVQGPLHRLFKGKSSLPSQSKFANYADIFGQDVLPAGVGPVGQPDVWRYLLDPSPTHVIVKTFRDPNQVALGELH